MWATSIGSTFAHRPVPGVRKSGMPGRHRDPGAGQRDDRARPRAISSASRSSAAARRARSLTSPVHFGRALAEEGADALLGVLADGRPRANAGLLGLDALVEVALGGDLLDLLDGERRLLGELARPGERRVEQLVVGHDAVDEAVARRPRPRRIGSPTRFISSALFVADQARQPLGAAEAGDDPELDLGLAEDGRLGGDPHVAGHRQLAAAAEGERVDRGDRRRRRSVPNSRSSAWPSSISSLAAGLVHLRERLDVGAGARRRTGFDEAMTIARDLAVGLDLLPDRAAGPR